MSPAGRVVVFGASSGIGLELARRLAARGTPVVAATRSGSSAALSSAGATVVTADVLDRAPSIACSPAPRQSRPSSA